MINTITGLFTKLMGGKKSERDIKVLTPIVAQINEEFAQLSPLSNDDLRAKSKEFRKRIQDSIQPLEDKIDNLKKEAEGLKETQLHEKEKIYDEVDKLKKEVLIQVNKTLDEILPEAFAVLKETARRFKENDEVSATANEFDRLISTLRPHTRIEGDKIIYKNKWLAAGGEIKWDMVHYDVQLLGGMVIHQGKIAEMATGEGKTLVATLPIYLNALSGKGVNVVTVNNYLSRRDSEWMGPIMEFHGLSVDCIDKHEPNSDARRNAYLADITYGTNNEFGFDYLRDNMARQPQDLVQREHVFAIVDEVDSVLIDDARTPLIISGPTDNGDKHEFFELKPRVERLVGAQKSYVTNALTEAKKLLASGDTEQGGLMLLRAHRGLPKNSALIKYLSEPGIKAQLQKTENYYLQDQGKEMPKVDAELYFVIDEKHNSVELTEKGIELITSASEDSKFFVLPDIGSIMADIEKSMLNADEKLARKEELIRDFGIKSERIHTINQLLKAYTVFEKDVEYVVMDNKVKIVDEQTGRILDGRRYSDGLHQAIEAKENVKIEAATQTYATITLQNYFRMYHKLAGMTGTAETEAGELWDIYKLDVVVVPTNKSTSRKDLNDLVYKTKREKYNAVIDKVSELVQQGRPVLVGTTSVEISELLSRMLKLRNIPHQVLNAKLHQKEAEIVTNAGLAGTVTIATNMAGRGTDIKLGPGVKEAGGLAIVGTERHESRRVDRQLRGRAGRQGDPGSSQFFVSLEDNLMRLFGSDRIAKMMDKLGIEEGEVIESSLVTGSIERAQKKVEENNFGIRKRLLEYDDVMNSQREVIYKKRRHALYGERLSLDISNTIYDTCDAIVHENHDTKDFANFELETLKLFGMEPPVNESEFQSKKAQEIVDLLFAKVEDFYIKKSDSIAQIAYPTIKGVYETNGQQYQNIAIPFSDGIKTMQVIVNLRRAYETMGKEVFGTFEKAIVLSIIDEEWKEHLRDMDDLKQSVQNAVYEQKDPLLIYKFESFELFKRMLFKVNREIVSFLVKGTLPIQEAPPASITENPRQIIKTDLKNIKEEVSQEHLITSGPDYYEESGEPVKVKKQPLKADPKIGRNDPCPCGSGKKYKSCHGQ
jgi:preprotein translocase subunit SecA